MRKKLFLWYIGIAGLFVLVYGCQNMAVQMSDGEKLYRAKCSSCHSVIPPGNHNEEQWRLYVDKYGRKMTDEEKRIVLEYLVYHVITAIRPLGGKQTFEYVNRFPNNRQQKNDQK